MNGIIPCVAYKGSAISYGPRGFDHSSGLPSEDTGVLVTAELMKCCDDIHTRLSNDPSDRSAHLGSSLTKGVALVLIQKGNAPTGAPVRSWTAFCWRVKVRGEKERMSLANSNDPGKHQMHTSCGWLVFYWLVLGKLVLANWLPINSSDICPFTLLIPTSNWSQWQSVHPNLQMLYRAASGPGFSCCFYEEDVILKPTSSYSLDCPFPFSSANPAIRGNTHRLYFLICFHELSVAIKPRTKSWWGNIQGT